MMSRPVASVFSSAGAYPELASTLMGEVKLLSTEGGVAGAAIALLKAAVPAILCALHPDVKYPRSDKEIIAAVDAALASADRETMLALADELTCEL